MVSSNSMTIDLENLQQQYSNLLIKYQAAVSEYVTHLNDNTSKTKPNELIDIKGMAYLGTGSAGSSDATTVQDCIASCSNNSKCTGATFVSNQCQVRTGNSSIISSNNDSYAIIPKEKQLLLNMENINDQLIHINEKITIEIQKQEPKFNDSQNSSREKNKELIDSYSKLLEERDNVKTMLQQYETLNYNEVENNIKINQNYYSYILLLILAVAICFLLFKISTGGSESTVSNIQYGGDLNNNCYFIIFIIIVIIIGIKLSL
jgi:hypothetical protein